MQFNNRDVSSVWDMTKAIKHLQAFTKDLAFEEYLNNALVISAVERQFEILGEAARRISNEFRQAHSNIDWQRIVGLRNIVTHRYDEVRQDILWSIIHSELDPLLTELEALLPSLPNGS